MLLEWAGLTLMILILVWFIASTLGKDLSHFPARPQLMALSSQELFRIDLLDSMGALEQEQYQVKKHFKMDQQKEHSLFLATTPMPTWAFS